MQIEPLQIQSKLDANSVVKLMTQTVANRTKPNKHQGKKQISIVYYVCFYFMFLFFTFFFFFLKSLFFYMCLDSKLK